MKFNNAICCIIKDEKYLEEFIIYHYLIGVEHFYIYDNESKIPLNKRLNHDFFKKYCTIFETKGNAKQTKVYNECIEFTKNTVNWLIILDGDEFIYLKKHKNINNFLNDYKDFHAIGLNWLMFGSSFHEKIQKGLIIENYLYCDDTQNQHIKTICKPRNVIRVENPHYVVLKNPQLSIDTHKNIIKGPFNKNNNSDIALIHHYWGKSMEDMEIKINRGRATGQPNRKMPKNYHSMYNKKFNNDLMKNYSKKIKDTMQMYNIKIN